jgi:hypothetical protein
VGSPTECNGKQQNGTMGGGLRQQWLQDEARCHAAKALLVSLCTRRPERTPAVSQAKRLLGPGELGN